MNADIWTQAEELARRPYSIRFEYDALSDGRKVVVAKNPELPGCMAQGATELEARENLLEARIDYIYALLSDGLPVPEPSLHQSYTQGHGPHWMLVTLSMHPGLDQEQVIVAEVSIDENEKAPVSCGLQLLGDFERQM